MNLPRTEITLIRAAIFAFIGGLIWWAIFVLLAWLFPFRVFGQTTQPIAGGKSTLVWYQPASSFPKWKARGIQTLIGYESEGGTVGVTAWCGAARAAGLNYVLQESASERWADPRCIGVLLTPDEPNAIGAKTPAQMATVAAGYRVRTTKPLWLNLDGTKLQWESDAEITAYCKVADVIAFDDYPCAYAHAISQIGDDADRLSRLAPGKPIVAILECSDQKIYLQDWTAGPDATGKPLRDKMHGPSADDFENEVRLAASHGVSGIGYFPDVIGKGWEGFDGTTAEVETRMKLLNPMLTAPAPTTQPTGIDATIKLHFDGKTWTITGQ